MTEPKNIMLDKFKITGNAKDFEGSEKELEELLMKYQCAIREVRTKLEVLNDEFQIRRHHNPIQFIKQRIKKPESIANKLRKLGYDVTVENVEQQIHDVAGVRVVCSYIDDIYAVADMLTCQDDVRLVRKKDYIKKPKESGYRSLHLTLETPIYLSDSKYFVLVEVQIRTIAMDFWASLDHQLRYKSEKDIPDALRDDLKHCADVISQTDVTMQEIHGQVEIMN